MSRSRFYRSDHDRWLEESIARWKEVLAKQRSAYHISIFWAAVSSVLWLAIMIIALTGAIDDVDMRGYAAVSGLSTGAALVTVATRRRMVRGTERHIESLRDKLSYPRIVN